MAMPSTTRQFSDNIASKPLPKGESYTPNTNELVANMTRLINEFDNLNVKGVPNTNKRVVAVRQGIEKEMPHLYQLVYRNGPPYPTSRIRELKSLAEGCLLSCNVDIDALKPKIVNVTNSISAIPAAKIDVLSNNTTTNNNIVTAATDNINHRNIHRTAIGVSSNTNDARRISRPPLIPTHSHVPIRGGVSEVTPYQQHVQLQQSQTTTSRAIHQSTTAPRFNHDSTSNIQTHKNQSLSATQKTLLRAVHDVVDKLNSSSWSTDDCINESSSKACQWIEAPAALSPDEFLSFDQNNSLTGDNNSNGNNNNNNGNSMNVAGANNAVTTFGTAANSVAGVVGGVSGVMGGMSVADGRAHLGNVFSSHIHPGYVQSITGGHFGGMNGGGGGYVPTSFK